jgi:hypothetical protein
MSAPVLAGRQSIRLAWSMFSSQSDDADGLTRPQGENVWIAVDADAVREAGWGEASRFEAALRQALAETVGLDANSFNIQIAPPCEEDAGSNAKASGGWLSWLIGRPARGAEETPPGSGLGPLPTAARFGWRLRRDSGGWDKPLAEIQLAWQRPSSKGAARRPLNSTIARIAGTLQGAPALLGEKLAEALNARSGAELACPAATPESTPPAKAAEPLAWAEAIALKKGLIAAPETALASAAKSALKKPGAPRL